MGSARLIKIGLIWINLNFEAQNCLFYSVILHFYKTTALFFGGVPRSSVFGRQTVKNISKPNGPLPTNPNRYRLNPVFSYSHANFLLLGLFSVRKCGAEWETVEKHEKMKDGVRVNGRERERENESSCLSLWSGMEWFRHQKSPQHPTTGVQREQHFSFNEFFSFFTRFALIINSPALNCRRGIGKDDWQPT